MLYDCVRNLQRQWRRPRPLWPRFDPDRSFLSATRDFRFFFFFSSPISVPRAHSFRGPERDAGGGTHNNWNLMDYNKHRFRICRLSGGALCPAAARLTLQYTLDIISDECRIHIVTYRASIIHRDLLLYTLSCTAL